MFRNSVSALALVTVAALATGCQQDGDDVGEAGSPPAATGTTPSADVTPTVGAPTPAGTPSTGNAANTLAVCTAVDRLIIDGSRDIVRDSTSATDRELSPEQVNGQLKGNLAELADDLRAQAGKAEDPRIRELVTDAAEQVEAGARADSPATWAARNFVAIPEKLTRDCHV